MSDLIDRQAVIDLLKQMRKDGDMVPWEGKDVFARIRKLPTIQPERTEERTETHACDLISRQQAIDALNKQIQQCRKALGSLSLSDVDKHAVEVEMASLRAYREMLENLPTVQLEPHEGHWIEGKIYRDVIECNCSECGQLMTTAATVRMNFCPNCGAKMTISTK